MCDERYIFWLAKQTEENWVIIEKFLEHYKNLFEEEEKEND